MALRLFLAAVALAAVTVGLLLPVPGEEKQPKSQLAGYEVGRS